MTQHTAVRQASEDDVEELVRLRTMLFETLGGDYFNPPSANDDWQHALATYLKEHVTGDAMRILVVDRDFGLAACGMGAIEQRPPAPHLRNGRVGLVIGVITDPAYRRRGYSRAIMNGLLGWFREREAARVDLYASHDGEPLYRELGFADHPDPAMYWRP